MVNPMPRRVAVILVVMMAVGLVAGCGSSHPSVATPFTPNLGTPESPNPCGALSTSEVAAATHTKALDAKPIAKAGGRGDRRCSFLVTGHGATIVYLVMVTDSTLAADGALPTTTSTTEPGTRSCGCLVTGPVAANVAAMVGTQPPKGSHPIADLGRMAWWTVLRTSATDGLVSVTVDMGHTLLTVVLIGAVGTGAKTEPGLEMLARTVAERVPAAWAQQA